MYKSPDNFNFKKPKRFLDDQDMQDRYIEKIEKQNDLFRPKESDFMDVYSEEEVLQDMRAVEIREAQFAAQETDVSRKFKRMSDIFEGVIVEQAEQNNWFGEGTNFYPTSKYDDIVNGVDGVVEFGGQDDSLAERGAVSFDVVFSSNKERIFKKLNRTKRMIKEGKLTSIKYFESENGEKAPIDVPRIVLGSRLFSAESLIELWGSERKGKMNELAQHPMQIKLLLESYTQLEYFSNYAASLGFDGIAESYSSMKNQIVRIMGGKEDLFNEHYNNVTDDIVYEAIHEFCNQKGN